MIDNLIIEYSPPENTKHYISDYNLNICSDYTVLPKLKSFYELDEFSSEAEERRVELEYILDDGAHISRTIGCISLDGYRRSEYNFEWDLFLPPSLRGVMGKRFRVNRYNGKCSLVDYLEYRKVIKLKKFLK